MGLVHLRTWYRLYGFQTTTNNQHHDNPNQVQNVHSTSDITQTHPQRQTHASLHRLPNIKHTPAIIYPQQPPPPLPPLQSHHLFIMHPRLPLRRPIPRRRRSPSSRTRPHHPLSSCPSRSTMLSTTQSPMRRTSRSTSRSSLILRFDIRAHFEVLGEMADGAGDFFVFVRGEGDGGDEADGEPRPVWGVSF